MGIGFVGRIEETKAFAEMVASRQGQCVILQGDSGVGKSALLREFADMCSTDHPNHPFCFAKLLPHQDIAPVLMTLELSLTAGIADSVEEKSHRRLRPRLTDFLRNKLRIIAPKTPWRRTSYDRTEIQYEILGSVLETRWGDTTIEQMRDRFLSTLEELASAVWVDGRVIVMIDASGDIPYLDKLLAVISQPPERTKIILACSASQSGLPPEGDFRLVRLNPLGRNELETLLGQSSPIKNGSSFVDKWWSVHGGSPLAACLFLSLDSKTRDELVSSDDIPRDVTRVMDQLLERVDEEERRVLQALAVSFEPADDNLVSLVADLPTERVVAVLRKLTRRGLVHRDPFGGSNHHEPFHSSLRHRILQLAEPQVLRQMRDNASRHYLRLDLQDYYWRKPMHLGHCMEYLRLSRPPSFASFMTEPSVRAILRVWGASHMGTRALRAALEVGQDQLEPWQRVSILRDLGYFVGLSPGGGSQALVYFAQAFDQLAEAGDAREDPGYLSLGAQMWCEAARICRADGAYMASVYALRRAGELYDELLRTDPVNKHKWQLGLSRCYHNLALVKREAAVRVADEAAGDAIAMLHEAKQFLGQALQIEQELNNSEGQLQTLMELAQTNVQLAELTPHGMSNKDAMESFEQALRLARLLGDSMALGIAAGNLGSLLLKARKYELAESYARMAMSAFEATGAGQDLSKALELLQAIHRASTESE